eukprot:TRINITY_DN940_c0_g1_i1.p1 TRINITY_DN940_c0_g1~~TRINITY_DN940_c0_g1_i1.p1  ORF type:complete len:420 (-),score=57.53 TRINITY_DN940_c0_g1_i1:67-1326(-)
MAQVKDRRKKKGGATEGEQPELSDEHKSREAAKQNKLVHAPDSAGGGTWVGKMITRIAVGLPLLFAFGYIIASHHFYICTLILFIQCVAYRELVTLKYDAKDSTYIRAWSNFFNIAALLVSMFYFYGRLYLPVLEQFEAFREVAQLLLVNHLAVSYGAYITLLLTYVLTLKNPYYALQYDRMCWTVLVHVLVFLQTRFLVNNILDGVIWFILPATLVITNDIVAYFAGLMFGRRILRVPFLSISPNKTWEGFISAIPCTMVVAYVVAGLYAKWRWMICPRIDLVSPVDNDCIISPVFFERDYDVPYIGTVSAMPIQMYALGIGLFSSLVCPFAGFFTSGMKRAFGIKDFASLFPGHGGMTDRMDCQMLMGAFVYTLLRTLNPISTAIVESLWWKIEQLSLVEQRELFDRLKIGTNFTRT